MLQSGLKQARGMSVGENSGCKDRNYVTKIGLNAPGTVEMWQSKGRLQLATTTDHHSPWLDLECRALGLT